MMVRTRLPSLSRRTQFMGLSAGELTALATQGTLEQKGNEMFAGYKTYFISAVMFALGAAMLMGVAIPEEVWVMLGAVGLGTLRSAVEGAKEEVKDEVKEMK